MFPPCTDVNFQTEENPNAYVNQNHIPIVRPPTEMSSTEHSTVRCACCDETGHSTRHCPELEPPPLGFDKGPRIPDDGCEETLAHSFTVSDEEGEDCRAELQTPAKKKPAKAKTQAINIYITPLKNPRAKKRARL